MIYRIKVLVILTMLAMLLSGCDDTSRSGLQTEPERATPFSERGQTSAVSGESSLEAESDNADNTSIETGYIDLLIQETIDQFIRPEMGEFEKAKAAFDYMIENTTLLDPVGLDIWRVRGNYTQIPSFVENRSLSVLAFGVGKCEDYAAALTMLLRGMGLEAEYMPGLTYSTQGELVDHAWTIAKIDGVWYHLDCQLEQNISRHGSVRYKYFMRGDATMRESHRWGQNLIDSRLLTAPQNDEIAQSYIPPTCPQNYPTPERRSIALAEAPDLAAIEASIAAEFQEYETAHGPLEPLELNTVPPVFALEGYGPQD